jgi:hypothetical protein
MIEKQESYSRIELLETGHVQLRLTTKIVEDGNVLSEGHHRSVVTPLDDIAHLPQEVQDTIVAFWTNGDYYAKFPAPVEAPAEEVTEEVVEEPVAEVVEDEVSSDEE